MADVGVQYMLTTSGGTVNFNDGSADQLYITKPFGLDGSPIRAPIDDVPFGHGGIVHPAWKGPRFIVIDGVMLITSTRQGNAIVEIRNDFEEVLRLALESILAPVEGTLAWTPQGQSARSLDVNYNVQIDFDHEQNYQLETFHFGLVAANPDW